MKLLLFFLPIFLFAKEYLLHKDITVTYFFVGELPSKNNKFISNIQSAWDDLWLWHYGGVDYPNKRKLFFPNYIPNENPFYCALPYNDLYPNGKVKPSQKKIPWYKKYTGKTICKNRWVKIIKHTKNGVKIAYAQWEDAGPNLYDDFDYVFLGKKPKNKFLSGAGIDVSPAIKKYLGLKDVDKVDWQFVDEEDVPYGPWKIIVTKTPQTFKNLPPIKWKYISYYPNSAKNLIISYEKINKNVLTFIKKYNKNLVCYINFSKIGKNYVDITKKEVLNFFLQKIKKAKKIGCKAILVGGADIYLKNTPFYIDALDTIDYFKKIFTLIKENRMYIGIKNNQLINTFAYFVDFAIYSNNDYNKYKIFRKLKKPILKIKGK